MGYKIYSILLLVFTGVNVYGQSCFVENFSLPDGNTRTVPLVLSGSNLNLSQDQICKITLRLKHESINQLSIRLVSPGGQSITLLGPATALSNTIFPSPTYNLTFISCNETPDPEPGYLSRWRNDQTWIGSTFSGTYHPHSGCFNDFNRGSINGTWQLEIQDVARFDEGIIECFSIEFCNSKNVVSASCDNRKGRLLLTNTAICEYDSLILLSLTDFPSGRPSNISYANRYVVLSGTELISYTTDTLKNLEAGNYTVCQFLVANDDISRLSPVGSLISNGNFAQEFSRLNLCGSVSDDCMNLTVRPIPAKLTSEPIKICKGGATTFKNQLFTSPGSYTVYVPSTSPEICDTLYQIQIEELDLQPVIFSKTSVLPCNGVITLTNASLNTSANAIYSFTGPGITASFTDSVTINSEGLYKMIVSDQGCFDSVEITIVSDPNLPVLSFNADTITCSKVTSTITVSTTGKNIDNTIWSRGINVNATSVNTDIGGKLIATVTHADGCTITDSLVVQVDTMKVKPNFQLSDPDLTCRVRRISTTILNENLFEPNIRFKRNGIDISIITSINEEGTYFIIGQLASNGCVDSSQFTIRDLEEVPKASLETFCDSNNVFKIRALIEREPSILNWTFPAGQTVNIGVLEQVLTTTGNFGFSYTSDAGCRSRDTTIFVDISKAFPSFIVEDDSLGCDTKTIPLKINGIDPNASYIWTGPNNFVSNNPIPMVNTIGVYTGIARYMNGCLTRDTSNVNLKTDETPFDLSTIINVSCEDTLKLQPLDRSKYSYNWRTDISPGIIQNLNDTLYTVNPGIYILEVSQNLDLCYTIPIEIGDARDFPTIVPQKSDITCDPNRPASISLNITNSERIASVTWNGANGFTSNSINIQGLDEGIYHYIITTVKGCNLRDTFNILNSTNAPRVSLLQDSITLTCDDYNNNLGRRVVAATLDSVAAFRWTREGDAAILSTNNELIIKKDGNYLIRATGANQCESTIPLVVLNDTSNFNMVLLPTLPLTCEMPAPTITPTHPKGFRQVNVIFNGQVVDTNTISFTITKGGQYIFESVDNRGCTSIDSFFIENRTDSVRFLSNVINVGCEPGNISLQFLNQVENIIWINTALDTVGRDTILNTTEPGRYFVNLISPLGCITADTFTLIRDDALPVVIHSPIDTITCNVPSINIRLTTDRPVKNVTWTSSNIDTTTQNSQLTANFSGIYKWILTADNGCQITDSIEVPIDTISPSVSIMSDTLTCLRPITFVRSITNDRIVQYLWEGPDNFVSRDSLIRVGVPGSYLLTTKGRNGCQSVVNIDINENKIFPTLTLPDTLNLPCSDDSLRIEAISDQPIRDLRWINGRNLLSRQIDLLTRNTGVIKLFVVSEEGCQAEDSTFVYLDTLKTIASLIGNDITCDPDTSYISAVISTSYLSSKWITPFGIEIDNLLDIKSQDSGLFRLVVERLPMCIDTFELNINADRVKPTLDVNQLNPIKCEVTEAVLEGTASHFRRDALIYSWSTVTGNIVGSNSLRSIKVDRRGTYTFRAIDTVNNCSEVAFISIAEDDPDLDTFRLSSVDPVCFAANDGRIRIESVTGGTAPFGISLSSTTPFVKDSIIRNLRAGIYTVYLRDSFGCVKSSIITLNDGERTFVRLPQDTTISLGASIDISYISDVAPDNIRDIIWIAGNGQNCDGCETFSATLQESTDLLVLVTNTSGCVAIDSMKIIVLPIINWAFPNILSGLSNINSTLTIPDNPGVDIINELAIFDRWGNIIWQAQNFKPGDPNFVFDIRSQSANVESGVYLMKIEATLINGLKWQRVKDFTIIK